MKDERSFALAVVQRLRDAGFEALWAGGCVRDQLLNLEPHDYDVATNARPEEVRGLFRRTIAVGASFGVVEVLGPRVDGQMLKVQVATFRVEGPYSDGRRPDQVHFSTAEEDAKRRDFTINGMFYDPIAQQVIDYVGGQVDLQAKLLRAIGDAGERFAEDKLRLLRAVRFAARFDLQIEPVTREAIRTMADQINVVSAERIGDEFRKMLTHANRVRAMNLLWDVNLLRPLFPELAPLKGMPYDTVTESDVWDHTMGVLERLQDPSFPLAFAAVLHKVRWETASEVCLRYRLSNAERERVEWLVANHKDLCDAKNMKPSKLKVILVHPGIRELLALHRADSLADGRGTDHVEYCEQLLNRWTKAELDPPPFLSGEDLKQMGLKPGPLFKAILAQIREAQLDGLIDSREAALTMVERMICEKEEKP